MRDALYFRGSYAELVYTSQPILKDLERLDRSGVVGDLVMKLLKPYGEGIERDTVLGNLADIQLSMILERYNEVIPDRVNQLPGFWPTYLAEQETT